MVVSILAGKSRFLAIMPDELPLRPTDFVAYWYWQLPAGTHSLP
ncbi:hypothetical protein ACFST9_14350 [Hymenobacter monticola]|nr:hypothetical protein [Hymenobacter monticola]